MDYATRLAEIALEIRAIKLSTQDPFTWASGYRMPIYNDNRLLLGNFEHRALVAAGFAELLRRENLKPQVIAGTSTAGISPGTTLADLLRLPFIYVRDKAKDHGLQNRIEGILIPGQSVVLIEDLLSTGGSSISAVEGIREAKGIVDVCLSIYTYGFSECQERFEDIQCRCISLLSFDLLLDVAAKRGYIERSDLEVIRDWRTRPFEWGASRGFPRVEREKH